MMSISLFENCETADGKSLISWLHHSIGTKMGWTKTTAKITKVKILHWPRIGKKASYMAVQCFEYGPTE